MNKNDLMKLLNDEIQYARTEEYLRNPQAACRFTLEAMHCDYGTLADKILKLSDTSVQDSTNKSGGEDATD